MHYSVTYKSISLNKNNISYLLITIATASFNTLSPNTNAYKFTSTCNALNIARIVNGSCIKHKWLEILLMTNTNIAYGL